MNFYFINKRSLCQKYASFFHLKCNIYTKTQFHGTILQATLNKCTFETFQYIFKLKHFYIATVKFLLLLQQLYYIIFKVLCGHCFTPCTTQLDLKCQE